MALIVPIVGEADERSLSLSVNLDELSLPGDPAEALVAPVDPLIMTETRTPAESSFYEADRLGVAAPTFRDDWYYRVHVIPRSFDLGNLLQTESRTAHVWNAHFAQVDLTDVNESGAEGIALVSGPTSYTYDPLEEQEYQWVIGLDGPAQINAEFEFVFDTSESFTILFTGTRAVIFAFEPQLPIIEELEWVTDVLEARNGAEQRSCVRPEPRQRMILRYLMVDREEISTALNTLLGHMGRSFAVPTWWNFRALLADLEAGAESIPVDTENADFRGPGFAILWRSYDDFEVVEVASVTASSLELVRPTEGAHDAVTTIVMPIQICFAAPQVGSRRSANNVQEIEAVWESTETVDLSAPDEDLTLYQGAPVLADLNFLPGTWGEESITARQDRTESVAGAVRIARRAFPQLRSQKRWEPETTGDLWALRQLLYALRGRQRSFWLPTFRQDFELLATVAGASTVMTVRLTDYVRFLNAAAPHNHIQVVLNDGTTFYREILSSQVDGEDEQLVIDTAFGETIEPADVARISYLMRMRLDTDTVQVEHRGIGRAAVAVPTVLVAG